MKLNNKGEVSVSSVNGHIKLLFNGDVSANSQIDTVVSSAIIDNLTKEQSVEQKFLSDRNLRFSANGGSSRVETSTVGGRVETGTR